MTAMSAPNTAEPGIPHLLLIAEDDRFDRMILRKAFETAGLNIHLRFFGDGDELLDYLRGRNDVAGQGPTPNPLLILMDLNMPRVGGFQALAQVRANEAWRSLPVVMFTTSSGDEQIRKSYALGANAFMTKSADFKQLTADLKSLVDFWSRAACVQGKLPAHSAGTGA
jgi:CheY-like chemotaxis protein